MDLHLTLLSTMPVYLLPKEMFIVSRIEFRVGTPRIEHVHVGVPWVEVLQEFHRMKDRAPSPFAALRLP